MGQLVSIICESMIRHDLGSETIPGFEYHDLDLKPSRLSATTLYLMQTDDPNVPHVNTTTKTSFFDEPRGFISARYKTRLISNYWPRRFDPKALDPLSSINTGKALAREPKAPHWPVLIDFLRSDFRKLDYLWCIYWPLIGHDGYDFRVSEESESLGLPASLSRTTKIWLDLIKECVLPLIPQDVAVLVHSDHGTARRDLADKAFVDGFLFSKGIEFPDHELTWQDVRNAERKILER